MKKKKNEGEGGGGLGGCWDPNLLSIDDQVYVTDQSNISTRNLERSRQSQGDSMYPVERR